MEKTLEIEGMTCEHCKARVKSALEGIEGITHADVNLDTGKAKIQMQREVADSIIEEAIEDAGYELA